MAQNRQWRLSLTVQGGNPIFSFLNVCSFFCEFSVYFYQFTTAVSMSFVLCCSIGCLLGMLCFLHVLFTFIKFVLNSASLFQNAWECIKTKVNVNIHVRIVCMAIIDPTMQAML